MPRLRDERLDERLAAEVDDARELRHAAGRDHEVGDARADVDQRRGLGGLRAAALVDEGDRRRHGARERERLQVDGLDAEARLLGDLDEAGDHVALRGDEEDLLLARAFLAGDGGEDLVVQDGVVERDRDGFLRLELDRRLELLLVDERELHGTHDDLLIGHAQAEPAAGEPGLLPEALELSGQALDVDDLALEHKTLGQRAHGRSRQRLPRFAAADLSPRDGGLLEIDPDAHTVLCHRRTPSVPSRPLRRFRHVQGSALGLHFVRGCPRPCPPARPDYFTRPSTTYTRVRSKSWDSLQDRHAATSARLLTRHHERFERADGRRVAPALCEPERERRADEEPATGHVARRRRSAPRPRGGR